VVKDGQQGTDQGGLEMVAEWGMAGQRGIVAPGWGAATAGGEWRRSRPQPGPRRRRLIARRPRKPLCRARNGRSAPGGRLLRGSCNRCKIRDMVGVQAKIPGTI
jgi:hypothetical protein